ncbi:MAG: CDP-glucose 4,6-dehydratase [Bdellovibrionota bacterium]
MGLDVYKGRRVFLTGHTGFKGAWLSEWLLSLGARVTGFSLDIPTKPSLFEELGLSGRMEDLRGDVRDPDTLRKALHAARPEVVFHLAAQALVRESYDDPIGTFATNIMGTAHLLEAARHTPSVKAAVVVTTDKVYENAELGKPFREHDPLGGHDPYSASKAGAEIVFSSYARSFLVHSQLKAASARAGNVIGGGDWAKDRLVPDCVRAWLKGEKVTVRNPVSVRPWQHVLEPLAGYLQLGQRLLEKPEGVAGEAFNFGPDQALTRATLDLVAELEKSWPGASHVVTPLGDGKKEAGHLSLDPGKAAARLVWKPRFSFAQTAAFTAEWYRVTNAKKNFAEFTREQIAHYSSI